MRYLFLIILLLLTGCQKQLGEGELSITNSSEDKLIQEYIDSQNESLSNDGDYEHIPTYTDKSGLKISVDTYIMADGSKGYTMKLEKKISNTEVAIKYIQEGNFKITDNEDWTIIKIPYNATTTD